MKLILINGPAGHGKDTLGDLINRNFQKREKQGKIFHFADYLKYSCTKYLNWDGNKSNPQGRSVLQSVGEKMRKTYSNFWADTLSKLIKGIFNDLDYIIIPDLRYVNEAETIYNYFPNDDVITINITRYNLDGTDYNNPFMSEENKQHQSENDMKNYIFDYYIVNKDFSELQESAELLVELFLKGE